MVKIQDWYDVGTELDLTVQSTLKRRISEEDKELIQKMTRDIAWRWKEKARQADNPAQAFKKLFKENRRNAIASIIAILELVRKVGDGKPLMSEEDGWAIKQLERF